MCSSDLPIADGAAAETLTRWLVIRLVASRLGVPWLAGCRLVVHRLASPSCRLSNAWALVEHEGRNLAVVSLIRIHRVGNDSIRSTFGEEVITVLHSLSGEDLLIRNEDASVTELKREDISKQEETYNGSRRRPAVGLHSPGPRFHLCL